MESFTWQVGPTGSPVGRTHGPREKAFRTFSQVTRQTTPFTLQRCNTYEIGCLFWKAFSFFAFNWHAARKRSVFAVWEALLKLGESCGIRETGCGVWETGCGYNKLPSSLQRSLPSASVCTTSLPGEGWSFFTLSRDAARKKNIFAAWETSLKQGGICGICEQAVASLLSSTLQRSPPSISQKSPSTAVLELYNLWMDVGRQTNGIFFNELFYLLHQL